MRKRTRNYLLVCAAVIVIGIFLTIIGFVSGGHRHLSQLEERYDWINFGGGEVLTEVLETESFTDLDVDCSTGNINLIPGDGYRVEMKYNEKIGKPMIQSNGGKLTVSDENNDSHFLVNFGFLAEGSDYASMNIYYPKEKKLNTVNIECDMGKVDVSGVKAKSLNVECSSGEVIAEKAAADFLSADIDMGTVKGKGLHTRGMDIDVESGEVTLEGAFLGRNSVETDMGSCVINSKLPQSDYSISTEIDAGDVTVNGEEAYGKYKMENSKAPNTFYLKCDYGDIDLDFI